MTARILQFPNRLSPSAAAYERIVDAVSATAFNGAVRFNCTFRSKAAARPPAGAILDDLELAAHALEFAAHQLRGVRDQQQQRLRKQSPRL